MVERDEYLAEKLEKRESLGPLMDRFKPHLGNPVDVVVSGVSSKSEVNIDAATRDLYKLSAMGLVKLVDENPPRNLLDYFFSLYSLWFWVILAFMGLTASTIIPLPHWYLLNILRAILGGIFPLFVPGYTLMEALYPKSSDLKRLERFALSAGLSLALVPLIGLVLNYTPWGIQLSSSFLGLVLLVLLLGVIAVYRKYEYWKLTLRASA